MEMGNNTKQMLGNKEIDSMIGSSNQINQILRMRKREIY
jgi:hypothetical protein